jgi:hypothetical protein
MTVNLHSGADLIILDPALMWNRKETQDLADESGAA